MQRLFKNLNIDFMGKRKHALFFTIVLTVLALGSLAVRGLNFGIDFTGGYLIEVGYENSIELNSVRELLRKHGIDNATVQNFGTGRDVLIRLAPKAAAGEEDINAQAKLSDEIFSILRQQDSTVELRRVEFVGPQVGEELKNQGGLAMLLALACIMIYIMIRFERKFSIGAVTATAHDTIIVIGVFSLFQITFDLTVLAAVLATIGYSLNDTIVVFDRIRENFTKIRKAPPVEVMNISINQTLSRTIMTGGTTLLTVTALFYWGGETVHGFALAMIVGILIGTFSSIYVASAILLLVGLTREDLLPVKKEGAELDALP